jgi:hypothetical protein
MALAPGLLGAIVSIAGVFAIGNEFFFAVSFVIAVLALIIGWFAVQSRQWWWLPLPGVIAVVWNPVIPLALLTCPGFGGVFRFDHAALAALL